MFENTISIREAVKDNGNIFGPARNIIVSIIWIDDA